MQNQSPNPQPENSLYEFLTKILHQHNDSANNSGLVAYIATLGFLAFIFIAFVTLTVVITTGNFSTPISTTTITNTQGGSSQQAIPQSSIEAPPLKTKFF